MRRGVINLNDIAAYSALIVFGVILFTLFLLTKNGLSEDYVDATTETRFASQHGSATLAVYLRTSYDDGTFADAIRDCVGECPYNAPTEDFFDAFCKAYVLQIGEHRIGPGIKDHLKDNELLDEDLID